MSGLRRRGRTWAAVALGALAVAGSGCGQDDTASGRTQIEFFQFKPEAVETFDGLIEEFERQHPDIDVEQNHVPAADTALRTRLVKNDVPDVLTLNGNGATYGDLAASGIFRDFTGDEALERTSPAAADILNSLGRGAEGETNGVPFALNADGIIYNTQIFDDLGLEVPRTWDELLATAQRVEDAGIVPFYLTWQEAWTTLPPFNPLAQNIPEDDFWESRLAGETTFSEAWPPVVEAMLELKQYGPPDPFRFDYNTGNRAMAEGEAAMYPQGIWAIPSIRSINPDAPLGTFPFPTTNDPDGNPLVSGVDVVLTMPVAETDRTEAALTFLRWLTTEEPAARYAEEQNAFSAVEGLTQEDPALADLNDEFETGNLVGFADHNIPSSIPLDSLLQGVMIDEDVQAFLGELDRQYDAIQARRGETAALGRTP
jgi:raffinose/stachyose/melibiose transport system substrate-binding protein